MHADSTRLTRAHQVATELLLAEQNQDGYWTGELSTSALSTATALSALALTQRLSMGKNHERYVGDGLAWLAEHQNKDGGWGDTIKSISNISTTMLARAAFHLAGASQRFAEVLQRADNYLKDRAGRSVEEQCESLRARYGKDRTFAVPILTTCALAGLVPWREVTPLPFELSCFPQSWFSFFKLPVVSYALPALIAVGQAVFHYRRPWNPASFLMRSLARKRSLRVLDQIQPSSGGFLEAIPLTSFVTLSLAAIGLADHPVAQKGVQFLIRSVRPDGSWAIDSNLSVWVTTLAVNALASDGETQRLENKDKLRTWLVRQQFSERHPYTGAEPGGWGWTHLPGSVPDADDTPGALLALANLAAHSEVPIEVRAGLRWLLDLQNRDGGWPTFCRGWGHLPFDRSGADLTAHVLRAIAVWSGRSFEDFDNSLASRFHRAINQGFRYLASQQRHDGAWLPLWFGNQFAPEDDNPTYGTSRVLAAYRDLNRMNTNEARRALVWLQAAQNADGGWGGAANVASSVEETALAVEALIDAGPEYEASAATGLDWLVDRVEAREIANPSPIGFYFAKLWYFEKLYPMIFTVAALGRACRQMSHRHDHACHELTP